MKRDNKTEKPSTRSGTPNRPSGEGLEATGRDATQDALLKSEALYRSLVEGAHVGIGTVDLEGRFTFVNRRLCEMGGYQPGEMLGMPFAGFICPEDRPAIVRMFSEAATSDREHAYLEFRVTRKDGTTIDLGATAAPVKYDGAIRGFNSVIVDITEQKQARESLRKSEQKFKELANSLPQMVFETDDRGYFTFVNQSALGYFGYAIEDIGKAVHITQVISPADHDRAKINFTAILEGASPGPSEYTALRRNGDTFPINVYSSCIVADDKVTGLRGIAVDISRRRQAEAALRLSEEKFSSLFLSLKEAACLGEVVCDGAGKPIDYLVTDINPAFETITGIAKENIVGRKASETATCQLPVVLEAYAKVARTKKPVSMERYFPNVKKYFRFSVFSPGEGRFATIFSDVTSQRESNAKLLAYQRNLRSLASRLSLAEERERRRIAMEVHDRISQTLVSCQMKLGELGESGLAAGLTPRLQEIQALVSQATEEMRSLTFEISSPLLYEIGLEAAVERLAEQMQARHNIACSFEGDNRAKPVPDDVRVLLFQTVRELLMNIVKHARASRAWVSIKRMNNNLCITVADNGAGFGKAEIARTWRHGGFGLFSARERLQYIGGQMSIESEPGRGTTVTLTAPLKRGQPAAKRTYEHKSHTGR